VNDDADENEYEDEDADVCEGEFFHRL